MRRFLILIMAGILCPSPLAAQTLRSPLETITAQDLEAVVRWLCSPDFAGRKTATPEGEQCGQELEKQFQAFGLPTLRDPIPGGAHNVYGWIEGRDPTRIIVIGAHYDHLGQTRQGMCYGADDNASGVAAVLELAQAFSLIRQQAPCTLLFQLYAGEEQGLRGSAAYCREPKFPLASPSIRAHVWMVNFDMIGHARTAGSGTLGSSDHASFRAVGVKTSFVHTGLHDNYHAPGDLPETLNYRGMESLVRDWMGKIWEKANWQ